MFRQVSTLLVVLTAAFFISAPAVQAADATFTVSGVHVDASGYSASVAETVALAQGRPKAWQIMYRRMSRQQDWGKQPQLNDTQLQRIIRNFAITNERRSTTRYTADISYNFNPAAVAKVLRDSNIAYAQSAARRILLLPMSPLYVRASAWTNAFIAPRFVDALVPFTLPIGDALDAGVLAHLNFQTATWLDIADVAARVHATEAVLVLEQFVPGQHKLAVTLKRIGIGETPTQNTIEVPLVQTAVATYPEAADATMSAIAEMWKEKAAVDFSQKGTITVDVRAASLGQWASVQAALGTVSNVTAIRVVAMDIGEARVAIGYLGTVEQLREALSQAGLQLSNGDSSDNSGEWILRQGSQPAEMPAPQGSRT
jgi:hypothetical protein